MLIEELIELIHGFASFLIIIGMLVAFLWKAAFYIELALGLIGTAIGTYIVFTLTQNVMWTIFAFIFLLIASFISASAGAIVAIGDGFFMTWVGIAIMLISQSGFSSQNILLSALLAAILVAIAAYLGSYADRWLTSIPSRRPHLHEAKLVRPQPMPSSSPTIRSGLTCPRCGHLNRSGASFCGNCGMKLGHD